MSFESYTLSADLVWIDGKFEENVVIRVRNGLIEKIYRNDNTVHISKYIKDCALIPGMINTHSHAFQRALRGEVEQYPPTTNGEQNTFWTWREKMYSFVEKAVNSKELVYQWSLQAFKEMLRAGITTVGEFHYLHHSRDERWAFDRQVLRAAAAAGIRVVLLVTAYLTAGVDGQPLSAAQEPFATPADLSQFWSHVDNLRASLPATQHVGVAVHSIRAVPLEAVQSLIHGAWTRGMACHMHVAEQPQEVSDCQRRYGKPPLQLIVDHATDLSHFTAVHATHSSPAELKALLERGGHVSVCPLTEGSLGDGIPDLPAMLTSGPTRVSVGSDCNARISLTEELRWLEYLQRVKLQQRGVVVEHAVTPPPLGSSGSQLFAMATEGGAASLRVNAGRVAEGFDADFVALRLTDESLRESWRTADSSAAFDSTGKSKWTDFLLDQFIFGASDTVVGGSCVAGSWQFYHGTEKEARSPVPPTSTPANLSPVVRLAHQLISIESVSGEESPMSDFLSNYLEERGWTVQLQEVKPNRFNVFAHRENPSPSLIFNTHIDTVPPFFPPFFEEDGKILRGRGACDTKSLLAAQLLAAERLLADGFSDLGLLFVVGEEVDHCGILKANELNLNPKFLIVGEPTESKLPKQQKGILKLGIRCTGVAAHSGYPELGKSAIDSLIDILKDLKEEEWPSGQLGDTTLNIGVLKGGVAGNVIPALAEAELVFRLVVPPSVVEERVRAIIKGRAEIHIVSKTPPIDLSHVGDFPTGTVNFNTDIPYFRFDGKAFLYGAGSILDAHSSHEFIRVPDLVQCVDDYVKLARLLIEQL